MKKNSKAIGRDSKKDLNSFKSKGVLNVKNVSKNNKHINRIIIEIVLLFYRKIHKLT